MSGIGGEDSIRRARDIQRERELSTADSNSNSDMFNDDSAFFQMIDEIATKRKPSMAGVHRNHIGAPSQTAIAVSSSSPISRLPPELMILIFSFLNKKSDLVSACLVCKQWADLCIDLVWFRPLIQNETIKHKLAEVMMIPSDQTYWDYRPLIRRLNLSLVSSFINDQFVELFQGSVNLERTTLVNCSKLSSNSIAKLLNGCSKLQSIDLTGVKNISDKIYHALLANCPRLQGLYLPGSKNVSKELVLDLVTHCPMLKRIRFSDCHSIDDETIFKLVENCPNIVELDLQGCPNITDESLKVLLSRLEQLREFKLSQNRNISYECFSLLPNEPCLDKLRVIDFTSCELIGDKAVERLVSIAPRLRNVGLSKCTNISDTALRHLSSLGKCLHWIHLGHCSNITDDGATALIRNCHRLQYVDFACCSQLTNETLLELLQLPRLRRIGLVKCVNISDTGIELLANSRHMFEDTLERVHLSYCTQIGIYPVYKLLMACPKLTHLSLSGISLFLRHDITKFCRRPPPEFSENQRALFCVFSGKGVDLLRNFLHGMITTAMTQQRGGLLGYDPIPLMRDDNGVGINGLIWAIDPNSPFAVQRQVQGQVPVAGQLAPRPRQRPQDNFLVQLDDVGRLNTLMNRNTDNSNETQAFTRERMLPNEQIIRFRPTILAMGTNGNTSPHTPTNYTPQPGLNVQGATTQEVNESGDEDMQDV